MRVIAGGEPDVHGAVCACILSLLRGREGDTPHGHASFLDAAEGHLLLHRRACRIDRCTASGVTRTHREKPVCLHHIPCQKGGGDVTAPGASRPGDEPGTSDAAGRHDAEGSTRRRRVELWKADVNPLSWCPRRRHGCHGPSPGVRSGWERWPPSRWPYSSAWWGSPWGFTCWDRVDG